MVVCGEGVLWWFVVMEFYGDVVFMVVCGDGVLWWFVMMVVCGDGVFMVAPTLPLASVLEWLFFSYVVFM